MHFSHFNYKNIEYPVCYIVYLLPPAQQQRIISLVRSLFPPNLYISIPLSPVGIPLHWPEAPIPTRRNIFGWSVPNSLIHPPITAPGRIWQSLLCAKGITHRLCPLQQKPIPFTQKSGLVFDSLAPFHLELVTTVAERTNNIPSWCPGGTLVGLGFQTPPAVSNSTSR